MEKFDYRTSENARRHNVIFVAMGILAVAGAAGIALSLPTNLPQAGVIVLALVLAELLLHRNVARSIERFRHESFILHEDYFEYHNRKGVQNVPFATVRRLYFNTAATSRRIYTVEIRPGLVMQFSRAIDRCDDLTDILQRKTRKSFGLKSSRLRET